MEDFFVKENELTKQMFDLDEIFAFQLENDIQIIRGEDYQYMCYINKSVYATGLTPMFALTYGIKCFMEKNNELRTETANCKTPVLADSAVLDALSTLLRISASMVTTGMSGEISEWDLPKTTPLKTKRKILIAAAKWNDIDIRRAICLKNAHQVLSRHLSASRGNIDNTVQKEVLIKEGDRVNYLIEFENQEISIHCEEKRYCKGCLADVTDHMYCSCGERPLKPEHTYSDIDLIEKPAKDTD